MRQSAQTRRDLVGRLHNRPPGWLPHMCRMSGRGRGGAQAGPIQPVIPARLLVQRHAHGGASWNRGSEPERTGANRSGAERYLAISVAARNFGTCLSDGQQASEEPGS